MDIVKKMMQIACAACFSVLLVSYACASELNDELSAAAKKNDVKKVEDLIFNGADVESKAGNVGYTPLMFAAYHNAYEAAKVLVERGADVNTQDMTGSTALMVASATGSVQVATFLIEKGADVNHRDSMGGTALMRASSSGYGKIVRLLLEHGADAKLVADNDVTALSLAESAGYSDTVAIIKKALKDKEF